MKRVFFFVLSFPLFLVCSRSNDDNQPVERARFMMDTLVRISVYSRRHPLQEIEKAITHAFDIMAAIEKKTSSHIDSSDTYRLGNYSTNQPVSVSQETYHILKESIHVSRNTDGAFDVTIEPVKRMWDFYSDRPVIPDAAVVRSVLPLVNYRNIGFKNGRIVFSRPGMGVDLGGVAKGYIVDQGVMILKQHGLDAGIIEAGGDLRIFGTHPERDRWHIAIRHPRSDSGAYIAIIKTLEMGIATSGDYERFFMHDGIRYHHILDPKTGFPAKQCISVTVVAKSTLEADAYATAIFVLGAEKGMALIESLPMIDGVIIFEKDNKIKYVVSSGLIENIDFL